jgi:outer membrane lipoprotein-sorting protein
VTYLRAVLFAALFAAPCLAAEPNMTTQKALDQVAKLTAGVKAFSTELTMPAPGAAKAPTKGSLTFMLPENIKMTMPSPFGIQTTAISDGKTSWVLIPAMNVAAKVDVTKVKAALEELGLPAKQPQHNIARPFALMKAGTVRLVGGEKAGDIDCWVFEGTAEAPGAPAALKRMRVLVAKKDGLARRVNYIDAAGKPMMELRYDKVEVNPEVGADFFQYKPPEKVTVMDKTEQTILMLKSMIPKKK